LDYSKIDSILAGFRQPMQKSIHTAKYGVLLDLLVQSRRAAKLTQEELAVRLSLTQSSVSKVERGERRLDVAELHDWCRALGHPFTKFTAEFDKRLQSKP
jgi:transcriptional regulator with XRE-family HTH domain